MLPPERRPASMFKWKKRFDLLIISVLLLVGLAPQLPSLASSSNIPDPVVAKVQGQFRKTGLAAFVPIAVPDRMKADLGSSLKSLGVSAGADKVLDFNHGVFYFTYGDPSQVESIAVPLADSLTADLSAVDFQTEDQAKLGAKIVGGLYNPSLAKGTLIVAYVQSKQQLRLYDS